MESKIYINLIVMIVLLFVLTVQSTISIACEESNFKVYYTPIDAEFYAPPTEQNIEEIGEEIIISSCEIKELFEKLYLGKFENVYSLYNQSVRIKIINIQDGKILYINDEKMILFEGKLYKPDKVIIDSVVITIAFSSKVWDIWRRRKVPETLKIPAR